MHACVCSCVRVQYLLCTVQPTEPQLHTEASVNRALFFHRERQEGKPGPRSPSAGECDFRLALVFWQARPFLFGHITLMLLNLTHTHIHPFNGPFSGTTQVSQSAVLLLSIR